MVERLICVNLTEWVLEYSELIQSTLLLLMSWLCPADARSQGISSHGTDDVGLIVICQPQWWISTTCILTRLSTHMNYKNCVSFSSVNQHVMMAMGNKARKLGNQQQWSALVQAMAYLFKQQSVIWINVGQNLQRLQCHTTSPDRVQFTYCPLADAQKSMKNWFKMMAAYFVHIQRNCTRMDANNLESSNKPLPQPVFT